MLFCCLVCAPIMLLKGDALVCNRHPTNSRTGNLLQNGTVSLILRNLDIVWAFLLQAALLNVSEGCDWFNCRHYLSCIRAISFRIAENTYTVRLYYNTCFCCYCINAKFFRWLKLFIGFFFLSSFLGVLISFLSKLH